MQDITTTLKDMWLKIKSAIEMTSRHMKVNVENQIMANAPSPVRKAYFDNLYQAIVVEAETHAAESENRKKKAELERRELELKEKSVKLREMLENAEHVDCGNLADKNGNTASNEEVECLNSPCTPVHDTNTF